MSKKINNDAMGQLLEGLTSSAVSPVSESSDSTTISESRIRSKEQWCSGLSFLCRRVIK